MKYLESWNVQASHNGGHYHGLDGFNNVQFEDDVDQDALDSVIVKDVHASIKLVDMVKSNPGIFKQCKPETSGV